MPKNIAIFVDGTWNAAGGRHETNVRKLFDACFAVNPSGDSQVSLYIPGVGKRPVMDIRGVEVTPEQRQRLGQLIAHEARWPLSPSRAFRGGAFGWGVAARIKLLYLFLSTFYSHRDGDKIFIFGFSRGAFIARSLTGFFSEIGLLIEGHLDQVEQAYALYMGKRVRNVDEFRTRLRQLPGMVRQDAIPPREGDAAYVQFHFLGVWDTVAALGLPWWSTDTAAKATGYHRVDVPPNVIITKHALAIHELRRRFEPLLFSPGPYGHLEQRWFAGAHADVGGGYTQAQSGRSDMALRWMAHHAGANGLAWSIEAEWAKGPASKASSLHHQIRGWFLCAKPTPRAWLQTGGDRLRHTFDDTAIAHLKQEPAAYAFWRPRVNKTLRAIDELAVSSLTECLLLDAGGTLPNDPVPWSRLVKSMKPSQFGERLDALFSLQQPQSTATVAELAREASLKFMLDPAGAEAQLQNAYYRLNEMDQDLFRHGHGLAEAAAALPAANQLRDVLLLVEELLGHAAHEFLPGCMRAVKLSAKALQGTVAAAQARARLRRGLKPLRPLTVFKKPKI